MAVFDLTNNHRRALASALNIVQRTLSNFMALAASDALLRDPRISDGQRQELHRRITAAQERVRCFRRLFEIPEKDKVDPLWAIQVGVSHLWELLEDCKPRRMHGYGELPEPTRLLLDQEVQKLIDSVEAITNVVCNRQHGGSTQFQNTGDPTAR